MGVDGPLLVSSIGDFEALAFGGQLYAEGCGVGRAGVVVPDVGVGGLPEGVGFGLGGEIAGGAGGARTHDRRIMRSMASCIMRPSCIDGTNYRTDGTCRAGIN
jgi:hypothetical protein